MLRDFALTWAQSHISALPMYQELIRRLDHVEKARVDLRLLFGKGVSVNGKPYLLRSFWEQFYVFELTPAQMIAAGVATNNAQWQYLTRANLLTPSPDAPVEVLRADVQDGERLPRGGKIVVDLAYRSAISLPEGSVRIRLDYGLADGKSARAFFTPTSLPAGEQRLQCSFSPLEDHPVMRPLPGPMAMFLSFCTPPFPDVPGFEQPISNIRGVLVTVKA